MVLLLLLAVAGTYFVASQSTHNTDTVVSAHFEQIAGDEEDIGGDGGGERIHATIATTCIAKKHGECNIGSGSDYVAALQHPAIPPPSRAPPASTPL